MLEMLVIKDKNSWGFLKYKNYKKSQFFLFPAFQIACSFLFTSRYISYFHNFSIFLGTIIFQRLQPCEMLSKKTTEKRSSKISCTFNYMAFYVFSINMYFPSWKTII